MQLWDSLLLPNWYNTLKCVSIEAHWITLDNNLIEYLSSDDMIFPESCHSGNFDINSTVTSPTFPDFENKVKQYISKLGGAVVPNVNFQTPTDALWISTDKSLACRNLSEVLHLVKASIKTSNILCDNRHFSMHYLIFRPWLSEMNLSDEFRVFVFNHNVVAISPKDTTYVSYIEEQSQDLESIIVNFINGIVLPKIKDLFVTSFVCDLWVKAIDRSCWLLDVLPYDSSLTSGVLFSWDELSNNSISKVSHESDVSQCGLLRYVSCDHGIQSRKACNSGYFPSDVTDLATGADVNKFIDLLERSRTQSESSNIDSSVVPLDFAEPIGAHVCDATITKNAKQYITQQEKHIITEHKFCFDLFKAFQCSETREVVRSAIKEKHGPTRVKVKLCCYGYKQVGDKCKFDEELHNARVRRTWMYIILCLTGFFVLIAIIFLILRCYLREKSRRKELEMLEHDPATFGPPRSGNHVARYVSNAQSIRLENPYQSSPPDRRTRNYAHSYSKGAVVRMSQLPDYHKWSIDDSQNEDEMYASIPDCDMKHSKYDPPPPYSPPTKELYPPNYLQLDKPGQSTSQPTTKDHYDSLKCEKKPLHSPPTKKKPLDDKDDGDSIENVDVVVYTDGATSDSPSNSSLINLDAGYQFMLPPKK